jgi:hypothetical protein
MAPWHPRRSSASCSNPTLSGDRPSTSSNPAAASCKPAQSSRRQVLGTGYCAAICHCHCHLLSSDQPTVTRPICAELDGKERLTTSPPQYRAPTPGLWPLASVLCPLTSVLSSVSVGDASGLAIPTQPRSCIPHHLEAEAHSPVD